MPIGQLLIETDILADYLVGAPGETSLLRQAVERSVCYTTMLNAFELFRAAESGEEREAVLATLNLVRVLGFSARYAQPFALAASEARTRGAMLTDRDALVLGLAEASKLTVLTRTRSALFTKAGIVPVISELPLEPSGASEPFPSAQVHSLPFGS